MSVSKPWPHGQTPQAPSGGQPLPPPGAPMGQPMPVFPAYPAAPMAAGHESQIPSPQAIPLTARPQQPPYSAYPGQVQSPPPNGMPMGVRPVQPASPPNFPGATGSASPTAQAGVTPVQGALRPIPITPNSGFQVQAGVGSAAGQAMAHVGGANRSPLPRPANRPVPVKPKAGELVKNQDDEENPEQKAPASLRAAPPWLVSLVLHIVALLIAALIFIPQVFNEAVQLNLVYSEELGDQLFDDSVNMSELDATELDKAVLTPTDLAPVNDPLAAPPVMDLTINATSSMSEMSAPTIGMALTGREKGMKSALLAAYGGNATTEEAVKLGLEWLRRNQAKDGSWSLRGPYRDGGASENRNAATAMALLAFQGAGHTHVAGDYQEQVAKAWKWMLKQQDRDGSFVPKGIPDHQNLYTHAQVTIALCELYGMTKDPAFKDAAQRAVKFAVDAQADEGGWRYHPKRESDMSVTGWYVMALQSALMAGLEAPSPTLRNITNFLDTVAVDGGRRYSYRPNSHVNDALSAEGLLCRQYLGWKHDDPRLVEGLDAIANNPISYDNQNVYYWYYATQAAHHMEGHIWDRWNKVMRQKVPENQMKTGPEAGSWSPTLDEWGARGAGRLYTTCLSIYMLEVYYRHLPIYAEVYKYKLQQF